MFRRRFWLSLVLTIPLVATSDMVMDWFGYTLDVPLMEWYGPVLGSIVFWWGGWSFLTGGVAEIRARQLGMMLLITMAISVAHVSSLATSLDWLDLEFWWELGALVTIMLLGHWHEMKAIGQARNALDALAARRSRPDRGRHDPYGPAAHSTPRTDGVVSPTYRCHVITFDDGAPRGPGLSLGSRRPVDRSEVLVERSSGGLVVVLIWASGATPVRSCRGDISSRCEKSKKLDSGSVGRRGDCWVRRRKRLSRTDAPAGRRQ